MFSMVAGSYSPISKYRLASHATTFLIGDMEGDING
jgi:hypothetical protein